MLYCIGIDQGDTLYFNYFYCDTRAKAEELAGKWLAAFSGRVGKIIELRTANENELCCC